MSWAELSSFLFLFLFLYPRKVWKFRSVRDKRGEFRPLQPCVGHKKKSGKIFSVCVCMGAREREKQSKRLLIEGEYAWRELKVPRFLFNDMRPFAIKNIKVKEEEGEGMGHVYCRRVTPASARCGWGPTDLTRSFFLFLSFFLFPFFRFCFWIQWKFRSSNSRVLTLTVPAPWTE